MILVGKVNFDLHMTILKTIAHISLGRFLHYYMAKHKINNFIIGLFAEKFIIPCDLVMEIVINPTL